MKTFLKKFRNISIHDGGENAHHGGLGVLHWYTSGQTTYAFLYAYVHTETIGEIDMSTSPFNLYHIISVTQSFIRKEIDTSISTI